LTLTVLLIRPRWDRATWGWVPCQWRFNPGLGLPLMVRRQSVQIVLTRCYSGLKSWSGSDLGAGPRGTGVPTDPFVFPRPAHPDDSSPARPEVPGNMGIGAREYRLGGSRCQCRASAGTARRRRVQLSPESSGCL